MTKTVLVHWAEGPVEDWGDCFAMRAHLEIDGKVEKTNLCNLEEEKMMAVCNHFLNSIEPYEIEFGENPNE